MVLKEYALRGMAERALVLTPASLVGQWREELECKFGLSFATTYDPLLRDDPAAFWSQPRIIASIATARRREHMEAIATAKLDIVIVDEAHHLRDRTSAGWKLVDALNKRFLLLLSATPVQNDLVELYNLLTLLKPGIFKTLKDFRSAYMTPGKPRQPSSDPADWPDDQVRSMAGDDISDLSRCDVQYTDVDDDSPPGRESRAKCPVLEPLPVDGGIVVRQCQPRLRLGAGLAGREDDLGFVCCGIGDYRPDQAAASSQ